MNDAQLYAAIQGSPWEQGRQQAALENAFVASLIPLSDADLEEGLPVPNTTQPPGDDDEPTQPIHRKEVEVKLAEMRDSDRKMKAAVSRMTALIGGVR